ncbi:MAG: 2-hydroxy-3-oxopropionate reductase [Syntrophus sp. RIFOXYC2_FULL_54_9]|nr:MAG: 2-hydroxy-3-oxopropionate reductase [Syntrophus sp. RIFOXYC2_FULL_54_9]HBB18758.1 2-hydroxy-3-oxopropionate reductase [Syntrophus sp. (in: bacteria)]
MAEIGFIGLGIMGKPMAGHLLKAGHKVYVYDIVPEAIAELERQGAIACKSSKEVAGKAGMVFLIVPDTPDVEAALFGKNGVAEGVRPGSIVVDMSSISPIATKEFARKLKEMGVEMLDAPVSGGQVGAQNATLSIMVGGSVELFERIKPFFEIMGKNIVHIGGNGDGQTCKVANQIVVALTIEAVGEALLFASKAGADPAKVRLALLGGFAQSRILELHGERMIKRTFQPGFRVRHQQKDLNLALESARKMGLSLPNTAMAQELFNSIAAGGGSELDHSALVLALEKLANHAVAT